MTTPIERIASAHRTNPLAVEGVQLMLREMRERAIGIQRQAGTGWSFLAGASHNALVMIDIIDELEAIIESAKSGEGCP